MPLKFDNQFFRCRSNLPRQVGIVIPPNATMKSDVRQRLESQNFPIQAATEPPHRFSFHYLNFPLDPNLLEDEAVIDNGIYEFSVKDSVLAVFKQNFYEANEFCWAFSTPTQTDVVAALSIGETIDIALDPELKFANHIIKYHFPSGVPDSGYGEYAFHVQIDGLSGDGFRIVSAYEPDSNKTNSRLPFFMGFRVFGVAKDDCDFPVWRDSLGRAVREALYQRWEYALLFSAFALESFIDNQLSERLIGARMGEKYTEHVLRIGERKYELYALNELTRSLSDRDVNKQCETINKKVFTPRNRLAHGLTRSEVITEEIAADAIRTVVKFVWDNDKTQRHLLLSVMPTHNIASLIDNDLLNACLSENMK